LTVQEAAGAAVPVHTDDAFRWWPRGNGKSLVDRNTCAIHTYGNLHMLNPRLWQPG
jgi:hypothetical protein